MLASKASFAQQRQNYDVVVYGMTSGGITAAVQASAMGKSVVIVGGWRERHPGGMMSGGLGGTDVESGEAFGGLSRYVISRINAAAKVADDRYSFEPRFAQSVFEDLLRDYDIPVFRSRGALRTAKTASRVTALETVDGQVFSGRVFIDASYEGDLMALSGISTTVGREPQDGDNVLNGFRGTRMDALGSNHNFYSYRRFEKVLGKLGVDPYVVPGTPGSGLLYGIRRYPSPELGAGDKAVQAYNFRMTMTKDAARRVALPSRPPEGFDPTRYEMLFRWINTLNEHEQITDANAAIKSYFLLHSDLGNGVFDINNFGAVSTDFIGGSWGYPQADYSAREQIWKAHERWIRGLFYALQYHKDARVPQPLREAFLEYGLDEMHYTDPHENDQRFWPYQLYVREARRMVNDNQVTGRDVTASDDTQPQDTRTISTGSYNRDSHHTQRIIRSGANLLGMTETSVWNEGNFEAPSGGADKIFTIPFSSIVPRRFECSNVMSIFALSATHEAFGAIRMEMSLMQAGQSAGAAAALAAGSMADIQDVPYDELVTSLYVPKGAKPSVLPRFAAARSVAANLKTSRTGEQILP
ncbi:FAD-dependent oxidoreductase [Rhizobium sp.]|uniref:FAD-dependent oxidoreductase n=1 Tax=Rhizobium sp. TaxID=391 RepID=UPI002AA91078